MVGGHSEDHEDEKEDHQCGTADGAGGDPEEHVPALQEAHQGADWVVDRTQVHAAWWRQHQPLHLHGVTAASCIEDFAAASSAADTYCLHNKLLQQHLQYQVLQCPPRQSVRVCVPEWCNRLGSPGLEHHTSYSDTCNARARKDCCHDDLLYCVPLPARLMHVFGVTPHSH